MNRPRKEQDEKELMHELDPRNESLPVLIRRCQETNTVAMYGMSDSFTIKFLFSFHYLEILFCNITNFLLIL